MAGTTYAYTARRANGRLVRGRLDAPTENVVVARLAQLSLSPVSIAPYEAGSGLQRELRLGLSTARIKPKALSAMVRQLATMISAGIGLLAALSILAEQTEDETLGTLLRTVQTDVEAGQSLSEAVAKHPVDFPPIFISMIQAGEAGGFLDRSLTSTAVTLEKQVALRATVKSAMTYPVVVLGMAVAAVAIMLAFIVPVFKGLFEGFGGDLPIPTQILVALSESMIWIAPALAVIIAAATIWWRKNRHQARLRQRIDPLKLHMPLFGKLMRGIAVAQFCRTFSSMLSAGVPLLTALSIVGSTSNNIVIEEALERIASAVRLGEPLSKALSAEATFPPMVTQMLAVGESSGSMEHMLESLADSMEHEVDATTASLMSVIEPLLVAVLGIVIGAMVVALYLPIFQIAAVIQ